MHLAIANAHEGKGAWYPDPVVASRPWPNFSPAVPTKPLRLCCTYLQHTHLNGCLMSMSDCVPLRLACAKPAARGNHPGLIFLCSLPTLAGVGARIAEAAHTRYVPTACRCFSWPPWCNSSLYGLTATFAHFCHGQQRDNTVAWKSPGNI